MLLKISHRRKPKYKRGFILLSLFLLSFSELYTILVIGRCVYQYFRQCCGTDDHYYHTNKYLLTYLLTYSIISLLTYLLTYLLLTTCNRVLLEKLAGSQPVKQFPAFYGTRRFIVTFTSARIMILSPQYKTYIYVFNKDTQNILT